MRVGTSATLAAVLATVLVAGARHAAQDVLATAPLAPSDGSLSAAQPPAQPVSPVHLPAPTARQIHAPASPRQPVPPAVVANPRVLPGVAVSAYQRAAAVLATAAPSCRLDWTLLAAIGQVESDQGRADGSRLNAAGVARPPIVGPRLDGRHGTSTVRDTDAGRLDGDRRFDHAVGPMQFLPATWAAVAVDGDGDGRRNVQDIDDAALGAAVYLCAGRQDLSTRDGARAALLRYNHSRVYALRVLGLAHAFSTAYTAGTAAFDVQTVSLAGRTRTVARPAGRRTRDQADRRHRLQGSHPRHEPTAHTAPATTVASPTSTPTPTPTPTPTSTSGPTPVPTVTDPPSPSDGPTGTPTDGPTDEPPVLPDPLPDTLADLTPDQVEAYDAAWAVCDDDLSDGWSTDSDATAALTTCLADQLDVPVDDTGLAAFVTWLTQTQDPLLPASTSPSTSPSTSGPSPTAPSPTTSPLG